MTLVRQVRWMAAAAAIPCISACARQPAQASNLIEFRLAHDTPAAGRESVDLDGETLYLESAPIVSDDDFLSVRPDVRESGLLLAIEMLPDAAARLGALTAAHAGERMALVVDARVRSAPPIVSAGGSPRMQVALDVPKRDIDRIVSLIRARWP